MGAGFYLIWPAFFTDVTDSYRLGRVGRLRTDLGGLYFNAIVVVATMGVWWATGYDAVLLVVATQILQMLRQLLPLVRFDGYHVLADLTGVPDLFQRIGPTLRALVPWRRTEPEALALKRWTRVVVTTWVLTVVPVLLMTLVLLVLTLPRMVGTALVSAEAQRMAMLDTGGEDLLAASAHAIAMVVVLLPIVAFGFVFVRLGRQVGGSVWRRTSGRPVRRGIAILTAAAIVAGLGYAWWPDEDRYRPVQAWEGGTLVDAVALARPATDFGVGSQGAGTIYLPEGASAPTRERPQLATVLVPTKSSGTTEPAVAGTAADPGAPQGTTDGTATDGGDLAEGDVEKADGDTWIFPFDEPLAPEPGDNQALAVNTTDNTASYSVAFALVWADGDEPLTNTNEAYAAASCTNCAAIAVAFQVVLVVGDANVAVPQNVSVAVNYDCTSCLTYSLAVQLFVTLDGPLSDGAVTRINELWEEMVAYGQNIGSVPLDEIQGQLSDYEQQILAVIGEEQDLGTDPTDPSGSPTGPSGSTEPSGTADPSGTASPSSGSSTSPSPSSTASSTPGSTSSSSPSTSPSPSSSTSTSPSPSPSPTPTTRPSPTPSPTAATSSSPATVSGSSPRPSPTAAATPSP